MLLKGKLEATVREKLGFETRLQGRSSFRSIAGIVATRAREMRIRTLSEFVAAVESIRLEWTPKGVDWYLQPWFRGHRDAAWELEPTLLRIEHPVNGMGSDYYSEHQLMEEFKLRARSFVEQTPTDDWGWLFLMQHYGLPTRLLDWTESALFALFFAVREEPREKCDAAVWVLNPWWLNKQILGNYELFLANDERAIAYAPAAAGPSLARSRERDAKGDAPNGRLPLAVRATRANPRIAAQRGVFTVHGTERLSLHRLHDRHGSKAELRKWVIEADAIGDLRTELTVNGISETLIFPELSGLGTEIRRWFFGTW